MIMSMQEEHIMYIYYERHYFYRGEGRGNTLHIYNAVLLI